MTSKQLSPRLPLRTLYLFLPLSALILLASCHAGAPPVKSSSGVPTISVQPVDETVAVGQKATFSVTATGTTTLIYQWQKGSSNISGASSSSYTTPATVAGDNGTTYRVIVSDSTGSVTSNSATLTVTAPQAPSITAQPANQTVTVGQTATFSVTATGSAPLSYQWQKGTTDISGATSASYTTPVTTLADSGSQFRVIVSNSVNPAATSNYATLTVNSGSQPSNLSILTYHDDNSRTGLNSNETTLTPANVNATQFGKLGTMSVTGLVDAEPLYVGGLTINGATHNVVFIATEHDMVYAFDADTFTQLWSTNLLANYTGETPSDDRSCSQVQPEIGITSTPVIDLSAGSNGTIFVVAMSKDSGGKYHQRLHALDLTTGSERMTPTNIQATYPGTGTGSSGGTQTFNPGSYEERAALLLLNGVVYTTWTSHCDYAPYTSWVIGYSESNLQQTSVLNLTANGSTQGGQEGGIWMSGDGPAADAAGNIYLLVGNGTFDTTLSGGFPNHQDYGNCFMKLSTAGNTLSVADYFAMNNSSGTAESESSADQDLGSGGEMLLPDLTDGGGTVRHLAVGAGKDGNMYIVDRDAMGKYTANDANIYQELLGGLPGGVRSAPAYFDGTIYYGPTGQPLMAFRISNARVALSPSTESQNSFGYPGTTPSISSDGTTNGIVWAIQNGNTTGTLYAYDAADLSNELFSGTFPTNSADKFVTPLIANGKVYVGTPNAVVVFGLLGP